MSSDDAEGRLSPEELERLAEFGDDLVLGAGEVLFEQGDESDALYVLERGSIRLSFGDAKDCKVLEPGTVFGEMFLARGSVRTADAAAGERSVLRRIDRERVDVLKQREPGLLCSLLQGTCATLLASERELVDSLRQRNDELEQTLDYLRRTREELDHEALLARTDHTTGLYNKRCLTEQFAKFAERAEAMGCSLVLVWLDLDDFREANKHGYDVGDAVLRRVGRVLRRETRSTDLPCRWGGDEFSVILGAVPRGEGAAQARRLHGAVSGQVVRRSGATLRVSASVGAGALRAGESPEDFQDRVNECLLEAKRGGKDRVAWEGEAG